MTNNGPLPDDVLAALGNGQTIEAIKLLRTATGLGLKEAKDLIDAFQEGITVTMPAASSVDQLPASVIAALQSGNKIEAIKLLREQTGLGLKEAKDVVEAMAVPKSDGTKHSPTVEKPGSIGAMAWLVALALVGAAAYYFFKS